MFYKVEFWILLFFLVRLVGITAPPLETTHSWRQVTGLMVSRNYLEVDQNILYPRVDDNSGKTGIIGMEFPSMNYLYFGLSNLFGHTHWYGRLINLLISSLGIFFFARIVKRFFKHEVAFAATLFLLGSIWFSFSRKMMPDTYCISIMLAGIYAGIRYLDTGKLIQLVLYGLLATLGILSKIPAGIYFALLLPMLLYQWKSNRKILVLGITVVPIVLTYWWYFVWNPYLSETFGVWYNSGKGLSEGFSEVLSNWDLVLKNFYFHSFTGFVVFGLVLFGLFRAFQKRNKFLLISFFALLGVFVLYIFKSGYFFYHHNYYSIPFVPVMALVAGYGVASIPKKWIFALLVFAGVTEGVLNQQHDFFTKSSELYKMELEEIADSISQRDDLIVINGNGNPQEIYLSHRKGWTCSNEEITDLNFIEQIRSEGCRFAFINTHRWEQTLPLPVVFRNDHYLVYDLTTAPE